MRKIAFPYSDYEKKKTLPKSSKIANQYEVVKRIGYGSFGSVFEANDLINGRKVALKVVNLKSLYQQMQLNDPKAAKLIQLSTNEPMNLQKINCQHVAKFYDAFENEDQSLKFLVMEYCQGPTLKQHICALKQKGQKLTVVQAFEIFSDVAKGIKELHENKIMHRDLHPGNIMWNGSRWVILDLGFSKIVRQRQLLEKGTRLGACMIRAPEMIDQTRKYGLKVDIWSLGIILFYMLTTRYLLTQKEVDANKKHTILSSIKNRLAIEFGAGKKSEDNMETEENVEGSILKDFEVPEQIRTFLQQILKFNSAQRMTINQLFNHPIFIEFSHQMQPNNRTEEANSTSAQIIFQSPHQCTYEEQCQQLLKSM